MATTTSRWDSRLDQVVTLLLWITLALGVFLVFIESGPEANSYAAAGVAGLFVLVATVVPRDQARRRVVREMLIVGGSILTMTAVGLTDGVNSPFLLLALTPVLYAGIRGGYRAGIGAAALSAGVLASIVIPLEDPAWGDLIRWSVLLFLVAITFGYAHRLLTEEGDRSDALAAASAETSVRLERLETSHRLLTRLASQAESAELNPIEVGSAALDSIRGVVPFEAATISLLGESGPVAVARTGELRVGAHHTSLPLRVGGREVGTLLLATERELGRRQLDAIEPVLQPAALAFSNVLLLQGIARTAIREERVRLARELHDEFGPSLASLGLALDLAAIQYPTEPALGSHLQELRNSVGRLVEDVRSTVTDLRVDDEVESLRETVFEVIRSRAEGGPSVLYQVDERRSARPSIAPDINAIVTEALRNCINHSGATTVTIRGNVDFDTGAIEVHDNGRGFSETTIAESRYGLVGMRERAERIGARLSIDSGKNGTAVALSWGKR